MSPSQSSRHRYREFVEDYKHRRLDDKADAEKGIKPAELPPPTEPAAPKSWKERLPWRRGNRREYLREYVRWLRPHRYAILAVFIFSLIGAGLEMLSPLFMRFIVDKVLLNKALDSATRLVRLNLAGTVFLSFVILNSMLGVLKGYRQRLLNARVMLSLRRALFDRLLHLPLPKLWDMKTGGILSRLTGDVDTTRAWSKPTPSPSPCTSTTPRQSDLASLGMARPVLVISRTIPFIFTVCPGRYRLRSVIISA